MEPDAQEPEVTEPEMADGDPLGEVRERLATVTDLPTTQRPAVFEAVNEAIAAELAAMDEV